MGWIAERAAMDDRRVTASRTVLASPAELDAAYEELLRPSFPPVELDSRDALVAGLRAGRTRAFVTYVGEEQAAIAVTHTERRRDVALLSYLAVGEAWRGTGVGGTLLEDVIADVAGSSSPALLLAEIEHPLKPPEAASWGDPRRRFGFYARHGARVVDLPYFQPMLHRGGSRVRGMLLLALHADGRLLTPDGRLQHSPLVDFLAAYLEHAEGAAPTDAEATALLELAGDPRGVRLLDMVGRDGYRFPAQR